ETFLSCAWFGRLCRPNQAQNQMLLGGLCPPNLPSEYASSITHYVVDMTLVLRRLLCPSLALSSLYREVRRSRSPHPVRAAVGYIVALAHFPMLSHNAGYEHALCYSSIGRLSARAGYYRFYSAGAARAGLRVDCDAGAPRRGAAGGRRAG